MPELSESIAAIREGAAEDRFTYLTILEYHVKSPEVLPALNEVLQDAELTKEIGWDLVQLLLRVDGSDECLETVARLGNPREVIIKVMESLTGLARSWGEEDSGSDDAADVADGDATYADPSAGEGEGLLPKSRVPSAFILLLGMLAILHKRIETKYPSRFLGQSLVKVLDAYQATPEMTTSVINLVRSLSGRKRPPLPTRTSSISVVNPDHDGDTSKNAPDPEAEQQDPAEDAKQEKLLQSFVTCVIHQFVNTHDMQWSPRLVETYFPKRTVPGKRTISDAFKDDEVLQKRDAVIGQLVALARDLGLDSCPQSFVRDIINGATSADPLATYEDFDTARDIHLSPGGAVCLIAYWMFSEDVFSADNPKPEMYMYPDHLELLKLFCGLDAQSEITKYPGVADALIAIGFGLSHRKLQTQGAEVTTMAYHHYLCLIAVLHPDIQVRDAATYFAELLLHVEPDDQERFDILEDLLENCVFPSLTACAVLWLKDEIIAAKKDNLSNKFSSPEVIEGLQHVLFPDLNSLVDMDAESLLEHWAQQHAFLLQVSNFAWFLFTGHRDLVPADVGAAIEERFSKPLIVAAEKLEGVEGFDGAIKMQFSILADRLRALQLH